MLYRLQSAINITLDGNEDPVALALSALGLITHDEDAILEGDEE